jgi:hypothetical protein
MCSRKSRYSQKIAFRTLFLASTIPSSRFPFISLHKMSDDVPAGWVVMQSKSHNGRIYWFNPITRESVWDKPAPYHGGAAEAEPAQIRASHLLVKHCKSRRPSSWKEVSKI